MTTNAFDSILPPLDGIDRFKVINAENQHIAYFRRIRDAVKTANMFRNVGGAIVLDETRTIVYAVG